MDQVQLHREEQADPVVQVEEVVGEFQDNVVAQESEEQEMIL